MSTFASPSAVQQHLNLADTAYTDFSVCYVSVDPGAQASDDLDPLVLSTEIPTPTQTQGTTSATSLTSTFIPTSTATADFTSISYPNSSPTPAPPLAPTPTSTFTPPSSSIPHSSVEGVSSSLDLHPTSTPEGPSTLISASSPTLSSTQVGLHAIDCLLVLVYLFTE